MMGFKVWIFIISYIAIFVFRDNISISKMRKKCQYIYWPLTIKTDGNIKIRLKSYDVPIMCYVFKLLHMIEFAKT